MATLIKKTPKPEHQYMLKACTRCHGDLVLRGDHYGDYYSCIQCGAEFEPSVIIAARTQPAAKAA